MKRRYTLNWEDQARSNQIEKWKFEVVNFSRETSWIIFNRDYDRIIFRNETVNLVSHVFLFCLFVFFKNGILPCKALVMVGESALNDVDEEVHDNTGNERNEARGSTSNRRCGSNRTVGRAKIVTSLRILEQPTDVVRMAHDATHAPFRFPICVASPWRKFFSDELW